MPHHKAIATGTLSSLSIPSSFLFVTSMSMLQGSSEFRIRVPLLLKIIDLLDIQNCQMEVVQGFEHTLECGLIEEETSQLRAR